MKGSELKRQVRGLCWGRGEPLTPTRGRTDGSGPRDSQPGRQGCPTSLRGTGCWVVCRVLNWAFSFLDVKPDF